jgi:hypothetical protein
MRKFKKRIPAHMLILGLLALPCAPQASAYETGIHYYLTYLLGHWCGLDSDADTIALADYSVDIFTQTNAGSRYNQWLDPEKESTRRIFHFAVPKDSHENVKRGSTTAWETAEFAVTEASSANVNPILLGIGIHTLQDSYSHEGFGPVLGHFTQAPDLPDNDPEKMVEAAEATWIAMQNWSEKVYGKTCAIPFQELAPQLESWAELSLDSAAKITTAWEAIAEKIEGHPVLPTEILDPAYRTAFKATANQVRAFKASIK